MTNTGSDLRDELRGDTAAAFRPVPPAASSARRRWPGRGPADRWLVLAWGGLGALIVVSDGSAAWAVARLAVVVAVTAGTLWLVARPSRAGGVALLACASVGIAVGVGIGVRHVAAGDLSARALLGLAELPTGFGLLVVGTRRLVRGLAGGRRVAAAVALVLATAVVVWILTPGILATNVPGTDVTTTPADVGLAARDVRFTTEDGVELAAWYVPSTNGAAVVLRHGAGSTRSAVLDHAAVLADHGYGVLATDARGHGDSGGRAMDFGWNGDVDIAAAVSFLADRSDVESDRIGVVGLSMGGEEAIGALAADDRIAAVVAEGATGRSAADEGWLAEEYGARGRLQLGVDWLQTWFTDLLTEASVPTSLGDAVEAGAPRPVLLVTAGDVADESHSAEHVRARAPSSVSVWTVPGAGHTGGLETAPAEWEETVIGFLDRALAP